MFVMTLERTSRFFWITPAARLTLRPNLYATGAINTIEPYPMRHATPSIWYLGGGSGGRGVGRGGWGVGGGGDG